MRCAALIAIIFCASAAAAQDAPAWSGYWASNAAWCANAGDVGEETPDWYGLDGLFGLEWSCDVTNAIPTGVGQSWAIHTTCLDAGYEFKQEQLFVLTQLDRLLIVDSTGVTANMVRCFKPDDGQD